MFCQFCGKEIPDESIRCPYCEQPVIDQNIHRPVMPLKSTQQMTSKPVKGNADTYALFSLLTGIASIVGPIGMYFAFYFRDKGSLSLYESIYMLMISVFSLFISLSCAIVGIITSRKAAKRQYQGHSHTIGLILSILGIIVYVIAVWFLASTVFMQIYYYMTYMF